MAVLGMSHVRSCGGRLLAKKVSVPIVAKVENRNYETYSMDLCQRNVIIRVAIERTELDFND